MKTFPPWLRQKLKFSKTFLEMVEKFKDLHTVCEEANCPNKFFCFQKKRATFLALGKFCTRKCSFCNIAYKKNPDLPDPNEIEKIANLSKQLKLKHTILTMVTRDDLPDEGAFHIQKIIKKIRKKNPKSKIEILSSDFSGKTHLLDIILKAKPDIFAHNLETTKALSKHIRNKANYKRSLSVLKYVKQKSNIITKSGIMVGLGEKFSDIKKTIIDLKKVGCSIITIGQYLQPSKNNLKVKKFITPKQFQHLENFGNSLHIKMVCGPFVRSSYYK